MSEHPHHMLDLDLNKRAVQRHWFGNLPEEEQVELEDAMIDREFQRQHRSYEDKMRARREWEDSLKCNGVPASTANNPQTKITISTRA